MAEHASLNKISPAEMAEFSGAILNQQKGPTTADALTAQVGKAFAVARASGKGPGGQITGLTKLMSQGMSLEDASPLLGGAAGLGIGRNDAMSIQSVMKDVHKLETDPKKDGVAAEYGIKGDMTELQKIEAVTASLSARSDGGKDKKKLDEMLDEVTKNAMSQKYFRAMVGKGAAYSQKFKDVFTGTSDTAVQEGIATGRESDFGKVQHTDVGLETERDLAGVRGTATIDFKKRAETELTKEGVLSTPHYFEDAYRSLQGSMGGTKDPKQQRINERAVGLAADEAGVSRDSWEGHITAGTNQGRVDKMLEHLASIAEHTKKTAEPPPLTNKAPALGAGRMGG